jgi:hypothetical protein
MNESMREKTQSVSTMVCSSCMEETHIAYDEGGKIYCFSCAFSYGAIDDDQWREDSKDEEIFKNLRENKDKGV